jgi:hypothetical protein
MVKSKQDRLRELIERVIGIKGHLCELTLHESRELEKLLRQKMSEEEFGWPAFGEERW